MLGNFNPTITIQIKYYEKITINNETLSVTFENNLTITVTILELTATKLLMKHKEGKVELRRL